MIGTGGLCYLGEKRQSSSLPNLGCCMADPLKGAYLQGIFPTFGGSNPDLEWLLQDTVN